MSFEVLMNDMQPIIKKRLQKWSGLKTPREDLEAEALLLLWEKFDILKDADNPKAIFSRMLEIFFLDTYRKEHKQGLWAQSGYAHRDDYTSFELMYLYDPYFERKREKGRAYYYKNREKYRQYYQDNKEEHKAYMKRYREEHREEIRERQRRYYKEHREYYKKYYWEHREELLAKQRERRRKLKDA